MALKSFFVTLFFVCGSISADFILKKIKSRNVLHKIFIDLGFVFILIVYVLFLFSINSFYTLFLYVFLVFGFFIILKEVEQIQIFNQLKSRLTFFSECLIEVRLGTSFKHATKTHFLILNQTDRQKIIEMTHDQNQKKPSNDGFFYEELQFLMNQSGSQLTSLMSLIDKLKIEIKLRQRSREALFKNKLQMVFVICLYLFFLSRSALSENKTTPVEVYLSSFGVFVGVTLMHINSYRWKWST